VHTFTLCCVLLASFAAAQQGGIELKNEASSYKTADFRIVNVIDARKDTSSIGYSKSKGSKEPIVLKGGAAATLLSYISNNIPQDSNGTPVDLVILKFEVTARKKRGLAELDMDISYGFRIHGQQHFAITSELKTAGGTGALERAIRTQSEKMVTKFDKWYAQNKENLLEEPTVTVNIVVNTSSRDKNYIMYTKKRKLTYGDFQHRPQRASKYGAATASGIYFEMSGLTIYDRTILKVAVGASFNKKRSWFKKNAKTRYVLDHEQLHYDITSYGTCEFIKELRAYKFSPQKYQDELKRMLKRYNEFIDKMQDQYDGETNHGLKKDKQAEWRTKINDLMATQDCFDTDIKK
jgi:hypothetical protein